MDEIERLNKRKISSSESSVSLLADYISRKLKERNDVKAAYRRGCGIAFPFGPPAVLLNIKGYTKQDNFLTRCTHRKLVEVNWVDASFGTPKTRVYIHEPSIEQDVRASVGEFCTETGMQNVYIQN